MINVDRLFFIADLFLQEVNKLELPVLENNYIIYGTNRIICTHCSNKQMHFSDRQYYVSLCYQCNKPLAAYSPRNLSSNIELFLNSLRILNEDIQLSAVKFWLDDLYNGTHHFNRTWDDDVFTNIFQYINSLLKIDFPWILV